MIVSPAARRYGKALAASSEAAGVSDGLLAEIRVFADAVAADPVVSLKLRDPLIPRRKKRGLMEAVVGAWKPSAPVARLLLILAENGRAHQVGEVAEAFRQELDRLRGIVEVEVTTAAALDAPGRESLEKALVRLTGRKVRLMEKTDPSILGGVVARIGGIVYDTSVPSRLEQVRRALVQE